MSEKKKEFVSPKDGKKIFVREWSDVASPKAALMISHGMAEHSGRYRAFAEEMNGRGFVVFCEDHRAHGKTDGTGGYSEGDIFSLTLADLAALAEQYRREFSLPVAIFGHSYGSFLAQRFIETDGGKIFAAVIGGSAHLGNFTTRFGKFTASVFCAFGKEKSPANLIKKLTFDAYDKKVGGSFISSVDSESERYYSDPLCGQVMSNAFYRSFFGGILPAYKEEERAKIPKDLPVLLVSGACDPVGDMGKSVEKLYRFYKDLGLDVTMKLYENARHEYLNDVSSEAVCDDIAAFLFRSLELYNARKGK